MIPIKKGVRSLLEAREYEAYKIAKRRAKDSSGGLTVDTLSRALLEGVMTGQPGAAHATSKLALVEPSGKKVSQRDATKQRAAQTAQKVIDLVSRGLHDAQAWTDIVEHGTKEEITLALHALDMLVTEGTPPGKQAAADAFRQLQQAVAHYNHQLPLTRPASAPLLPQDSLINFLAVLRKKRPEVSAARDAAQEQLHDVQDDIDTLNKVADELTFPNFAGTQKLLLAERDAIQTELDLRDEQKDLLADMEQRAVALFENHAATGDAVADLFSAAVGRFVGSRLGDLAAQCRDLHRQIPIGNAELAPTTRYENLYGRVYDTKLVAALVAEPPPGVQHAMTQTTQAICSWLDDFLKKTEQLDPQAKSTFLTALAERIEGDPRFWLAEAPLLEDFCKAPSGPDAFNALQAYLMGVKSTGADCISVPFTLVKLALAARDAVAMIATGASQSSLMDMYRSLMPWLYAADQNYRQTVGPQANRTAISQRHTVAFTTSSHNGHASQPVVITSGGTLPPIATGITLPSMPSANLPNGDFHRLSNAARTRPIAKFHPPDPTNHLSSSQKTMFERGIAFGTGVSGSTNIMLYLFAHLRSEPRWFAGVATSDFLLGTLMFLVHDGGHSIQEVMWVANQLDHKLRLGLNFPKIPQGHEFISTTDRVKALFGHGENRRFVEKACNAALDGTVEYFNLYSPFRKSSTDSDGS